MFFFLQGSCRETELPLQIYRSAMLFVKPGLKTLFFGDFADAFDLAVNNLGCRLQ